MSHDHAADHKEEKFSVTLFLLTVGGTLAVMFAGLAWLAPELWRTQLEASAWSFALAFLGAHLLAAFLEFFFHRYVLHYPVVPVLSYFYKQHTLHHALTRVSYKKTGAGGEVMPCLVHVENRYPIEQEHQQEASFFPWYSLAIFTAIASPVLALGQWLFPTAPVLLASVLAIAWSLTLYELLHAVEHLPQTTWDRLLEHPSPRRRRFWRKAYAFHLRHHADIRSNEAISGFFGLPVPDWVFGTYVNPESIFPHGGTAPVTDFAPPRPRSALIRWLDVYAERTVKERRTQRAGA